MALEAGQSALVARKDKMMKRVLLTLLLVFSTANLTISITYAALCQGKGGARACGEQCVTASDGQCGCTGSCTKEELDWVAGAHGGDEELLMY